MKRKGSVYFCNGKYVKSDQAVFSVNDLGVVRGFGLFESMRTYHGHPFLLEEHLNRLFGSIEQLGLKSPVKKSALVQIIERLLQRNNFQESLVRIIVTGGVSYSLLPQGKPSLTVMVDPFHPFPTWQYEKGIHLMTAPFGRIFPEIKSTIYFAAVTKTMDAIRKGFTEVVYMDSKKAILEGTTYSVFAVLPGPYLVTPKDGVLPGVTAECVIQIARKLKLTVRREPISLSMLRRAKELFITSSNRELIPAVRVDRFRIGNGKPGPLTQQLHREYLGITHSG